MENLLENLPSRININVTKEDLLEFAQFLINEVMSKSDAGQKSVFNLDEAAMFCGITTRTIYKKTSNGEIPHYKQAGKLFFKRVDLEAWLTEKKGCYKPDISAKGSTYHMISK